MSPHIPDIPFEITKPTWDGYYHVQKSGSMNMMGHHSIGYFMRGNHYKQAYQWFEEEGNTEPLKITE
jgi:hypothetical protein